MVQGLKWWLIAACLFCAITLWHFHGLFAVPLDSALWGISISADPIGNLIETSDAILSWQQGCARHLTMHSVPFGSIVPFDVSRFLVPGWDLFAGLALLTGKLVMSLNLAIIGLFAMNYFITFWCARRLCKDPVVAMMPAVLVTFNAYGYAHSWAHLGLTPIFYFPAFIYAFSKLYDTRQWRYGVACAGVASLSLYTSPYYLYFMVWVAIALFVGYTVACRRWTRQHWLIFAGTAFLVVVLAFPYLQETYMRDYSPYWKQSWSEVQYSSVEWLNSFSAHPADYVLPFVHQALYGEVFQPYLVDPMRMRHVWSDEFPIFLGFGPLLFLLACIYCLANTLANRINRSNETAVAKGGLEAAFHAAKLQNRGLYLGLVGVAWAAFLISLVPTVSVFGLTIPMPNEFLRHVVPFRSYSRLAIVVLVALALLMALVVDQSRKPRLWAGLAIALAAFDSWPVTLLHNASRDTPYIKYLRERPERVMMRLESQNVRHKRIVDLEAVLAEKDTLNGEVNFNYGYTDLLLNGSAPHFNLGQLAAMGAELLVIDGQINLPPRDQPYAQVLRYFPEDNIQILKLTPDPDPRLKQLFGPYLDAHQADHCFVADKQKVIETLKGYYQLLQGEH